MVSESEIVWTIVVAGGSGHRFGSLKQFEELGGRRVVDWALAAAQRVSAGVVLVVPEGHDSEPGSVVGGVTRTGSVANGLAAVPASATIIAVHDGARPFAAPAMFERGIRAVSEGADAAVPGVAVTDTIKRIDHGGFVIDTPDRASLVAVQTPQVFRAAVLRAAHATGVEATDDAALVESIGGRVVVIAGDTNNRKLTHPDDLAWARAAVAR